MWFNSFLFLLYLAAVLAVYHSIPAWRARKAFLLVSSYLFYACWNPPFLTLLFASSSVDYLVGRQLGRVPSPAARRLLVLLSCTTNLGILAFFKYAGFLLDNYDALMRLAGLDLLVVGPPSWLAAIVLPVGISFYTFHGLSYIIDVYAGRKAPVDDFLDFYLFVAFFPQLVAGPILRATQFMPQLVSRRVVRLRDWEVGGFRIVLGLFQKAFMADNLAPLANLVFEQPLAFSAPEQWIGVYAFALQIYFDFAGYSNIAIGTARLLGFEIPDNFNLPYLAVGFRDFWRRWHISLSSWLRDYLYIPLGGSRGGSPMTYRNLVVTMFLGGLWHGATWSFAVWGMLHGVFLMAEHRLDLSLARVPDWIRQSFLWRLAGLFLTFHLTCLAWVFFRLNTSVGDAARMCASLLSSGAGSVPASGFERVVYLKLGFLGFAACWAWERFRGSRRMPDWLCGAAAACMLYLVIVGWGDASEFIYFQF